MNVDLVDGYLAAFEAANPDKRKPRITYKNGWYRVSSITKPVRESKLAEMRDVLLKRVESAQHLNTQQGS
ncbi:hypothetical protein ACM73L_31515 [Pseudomonas aeruginosa]|nr:hypothetical protein [Pseudomonas aeruginosa]OWG38427.1 hypothetical protein CAQ69_09770 [Stutzerimonas stutzeri]MCR7874149.1 hypothetical protein [Pseudomonas aeruginosa]HBO2935180.1 hypothetical protein [Pseudomonas aeruginosa]HBP4949429.1 hypothetical protein [Pseudomonas aeruginosa]HEC1424171.1 hypothetical protein [Pseudomonas aeruginosa]